MLRKMRDADASQGNDGTEEKKPTNADSDVFWNSI